MQWNQPNISKVILFKTITSVLICSQNKSNVKIPFQIGSIKLIGLIWFLLFFFYLCIYSDSYQVVEFHLSKRPSRANHYNPDVSLASNYKIINANQMNEKIGIHQN